MRSFYAVVRAPYSVQKRMQYSGVHSPDYLGCRAIAARAVTAISIEDSLGGIKLDNLAVEMRRIVTQNRRHHLPLPCYLWVRSWIREFERLVRMPI